MLLKRSEWYVAGFCALYVPVFTWLAWRGHNYEFVLYAAVVALAGICVIARQRSAALPLSDLWGLALWGLLHMAGGNAYVGDVKLYDVTLVPLIGPPYDILSYDHVVHFFGFGVATSICLHVLRGYLPDGSFGSARPNKPLNATLCILVVLMGLGVGAVNELVEFVAVIAMPETGVGGYENTLLDILFNLFGAVTAVMIRR